MNVSDTNYAMKDTKKTKFVWLVPEKWPVDFTDKFQEDIDFRREFPLISSLDSEET